MGSAGTVAVAAPNQLSADAGARTGEQGGNAVDAAVAAILVAMVTEPGIVSLGGGAFATVLPGDGGPAVTVDGCVEMPGRGLTAGSFGRGLRDVVTGYGGRTEMTVGPGSVATPGALAACQDAHRRFGRLPWPVVVEPAIEVARDGFPLGAASDQYLGHVRDLIFGDDPAIRAALHHRDGSPVRTGERVRIGDLADFLERVARHGAAELHVGPTAQALAEMMARTGGLVTRQDLATYRPVLRPALTVDLAGWRLSTNPAPSIGGPVLAAMLLLLDGHPSSSRPADDLARLIAVQRAVLAHRAGELDAAPDRIAAGHRLVAAVRAAGRSWLTAPSTAHVSAVDRSGTACAVTASSGYGAGICVPGTGVWLNNCLGEHELNRDGPHSRPVGQRLASNMAPTVGRSDGGDVLAIGSPGADRITTALAQVITAFVHGGCDLQEAVDRPRLHISRTTQGQEAIEHEEDLAVPADPRWAGIEVRTHPRRSMYFGGVAAVTRDAAGRLSAAADPRRAGAVGQG